MLIALDPSGEKPIYEQLLEALVRGIASGALEEGEALPSARALAGELGINYHTVHKVYDLLREEKLILMGKGAVAVVGPRKKEMDLSPSIEKKLEMCAAEAICKGVDEERFVQACIAGYRKMKGE